MFEYVYIRQIILIINTLDGRRLLCAQGSKHRRYGTVSYCKLVHGTCVKTLARRPLQEHKTLWLKHRPVAMETRTCTFGGKISRRRVDEHVFHRCRLPNYRRFRIGFTFTPHIRKQGNVGRSGLGIPTAIGHTPKLLMHVQRDVCVFSFEVHPFLTYFIINFICS